MRWTRRLSILAFVCLQHIALTTGFQGQTFPAFTAAHARAQQLRSTSHSSELPTPAHLSILRGGKMPGSAPSEARIVVLGTGKDDPSLSRLELLPAAAKVVAMGASLADFEGKDDILAEANILMVSHTPGVSFGDLFTALASRMPNLAWVHARSAGIEHLVCPALLSAAASGIPVTNAKGVFSHSLAEYALLAAGYFAKDLPRWVSNKAKKEWDRYPVGELRGTTMGILGYGDIGHATAHLAKAYGMKVIASRRRPELSKDDPLVDEMVPNSDLRSLFAASDYIVCCLPATAETENIVNEELLATCKPGAVFINVGRGAVVDEDALISALSSGKLRGAALDVFRTEPLPQDSPIWTLENVLLSPHNADLTGSFLHEAVEHFAQQGVPAFLAGLPLPNQVDPSVGY
mmetsp:Transcript_67937/g.162219  ORF Transcript_67937/g.162219 Transcript_67937/m.162219 type:complete len:405 (+) Transcript_67937:52-1266(+)